jgi:Uma2 family endonuclease
VSAEGPEVLVTTAAVDLQHPIGPHTVDQWRAANHPTDGGRLELIWGHYHVSPPPDGPQQYAAGVIYQALWDAVHAAGRTDLHPVLAVGVEITTALRTALIPDVAILNTRPAAVSFPPEALELAVEVWSPGNSRSERETKIAAYAAADVPLLWTVESRQSGPQVDFRTFELVGRVYRERANLTRDGIVSELPGPVPVTLTLADLIP